MKETPAEKKLIQARVSLLLDHPFFGHLSMFLELVEKEKMFPPTMATNGKKLYFNSDFVMKLPLMQLQGVFVHEIVHIILGHLARRGTREHLKWNIACDFADNHLVRQEFELPENILYNPKFGDNIAEWIYNQLPDPITVTVTLDSHEEWGEWSNGGKDGEGKGEKGDGSDGGDGGENGDNEGDDLEQQWRERVAQASTQARMKGKMPGSWQTIIDGILQPKLDWRTVLRDVITSCAKSDFRLMPPNKKHLWRNIYLPSITGEEINIAVVIDTSGSISDDEILDFLSEVKGICDSYQEFTIYLCTCDTKIHQRWEIHPFDPLPTEFRGRGGTSFVEPIQEAANLPITTLVYLTDLYGTFPEQPWFPVIWVCNTDEKPPWGMLIRLPEKK